jgi:hypothetical protein
VARDASGNFSAGTITASLSGNATSSTSTLRLTVPDTRAVDDQPQNKIGNAITADFKNNTAVSNPPVNASGTYSHIITVAGWDTAGGSGGWPTQLSVGTQGMAYRQATSSTVWGAWTQFVTNNSGTWSINVTGNAATATNLSTNRTNWSTNGTISAVVGQLAWKNYNNNHTIFDASASTSPDGGAVNNTNAAVAWTGTYPTLMGWNGSTTYGVRVDSARVADNGGVTSISATTPIAVNQSTGAVTVSHANSGVTAGTYNNVTVNATGHVTGGSNVAYLTAESDTLATVTNRGNTATASIGLPAGESNGYCFWGNGSSYKILMGVTAGLFQYGTVTDYSIKMQMDAGSTGRGFTWGRDGVKPIASLNSTSGNMQIAGTFSALSKSFLIDHPTKPGMKLRHGSLEGPEDGVYVRGKLVDADVIELPDYWTGLVHADSITVNLTAASAGQQLYVERVENNCVYVVNETGKPINCFYTVYGERKDVDKLQVEIE